MIEWKGGWDGYTCNRRKGKAYLLSHSTSLFLSSLRLDENYRSYIAFFVFHIRRS